MYDPRSELREFVGASRAEAVSKACSFFGLSEGDLDVGEPAPGDVYGLAGRAVVVAGPKGRTVRPSGDRDGGDRDGRERGRDRGDRDRGPRERHARGEGGRDRDRGRERGGRDRDRDRGGDRDRDRDRGGDRASRPVESFAAAPAESPEPSVGHATSPLSRVGEYVLGIVERMEIGPFEISESAEGDLTVVAVQGAAAVALSAGDGRTVDAVALLANQASAAEGDDAKRVVLDVNGDQGRREDYLAKLAEKAARRATETGRSVAIDPMNPRDRRIVHVALREEPGIATMSVGVGRYRQVVVVPEGAPEFEEARRQASTRREE